MRDIDLRKVRKYRNDRKGKSIKYTYGVELFTQFILNDYDVRKVEKIDKLIYKKESQVRDCVL